MDDPITMENPYTMDEDQFEFFTEAVETALEVVGIPDGVITSESIEPGSISPEHCDLGANWDFSGDVSSPSISRAARKSSAAIQRAAEKQKLKTATTFNNYNLTNESVLFVNAQKKVVVVTLPHASKNSNRVFYVKRVDDNAQSSCVLVTLKGDKIDLVTSISIPERGCITCISSGEGWYVLSNYS
tara:strand:+ start:3940 stop:4497 length:558 start_codon:yes stop_codon:yes gene_type:complete